VHLKEGDVFRFAPFRESGPGLEVDEDPTPAAGRSIDVLVVEDEDDTRDALIDLLRWEGFAAQGAVNGVDALRLLHRGRRPLIMLLDLKMPLMDGWELCQVLNASPDPTFSEIPIAIVTGRSRPIRLPERRIDAGLFPKPVDFDSLLETVRSYCR